MSDEVERVMEVANPAERAAAGVDPALARWRGFSDSELQVIANRLATGLLAQDPSQKKKDCARLIDEINTVQNRRETERTSYRGPGRYRRRGDVYEVLGRSLDRVILRAPDMALGELLTETMTDFDGRDFDGTRIYEYLGPLEGS